MAEPEESKIDIGEDGGFIGAGANNDLAETNMLENNDDYFQATEGSTELPAAFGAGKLTITPEIVPVSKPAKDEGNKKQSE
jgi:hypothetical protein